MMFSQQPPFRSVRELQRDARDRAKRIREAHSNCDARHNMRLTLETLRPVPFDELPEPHFMQETDVDLESFLRRNQLTDALRTYLRSQARRVA